MRAVLVVLALAFVGCSSPSLHIKIYRSTVAAGGLVRKQAGEVILYKDSDGYYCESRDDLETIIQALESK